MKLVTTLVAFMALAVVPAFAESTYLIKYVANLPLGDSTINVSNTGSEQGANLQLNGSGFIPASGNICVNIYVFTPDEQEQECCSCLLTPNALATFSARTDLTSNPLTGRPIVDAVIKLVATAACNPLFQECFPSSSASFCNAATAGRDGQPLATGLVAWGTTLHANTSTAPPSFQVTETHFENGFLSNGELNRITGFCANIKSDGSGSGICAHDGQNCVATPPSLR